MLTAEAGAPGAAALGEITAGAGVAGAGTDGTLRPGVLSWLRVLLIWDNLAGHTSWHFTPWLFQHGIMPLYTPLSGSWLNMAESLQRIIVGRALSGQHPQTQAELITWLEETVAGWNLAPTPFTWDGKRRERRGRARQRRLGGSAASAADDQLFAA